MASQFFLILVSLLLVVNTFSSKQPLCHDEERYYLLQFKQSFMINKNASSDPFAHPKLESWNEEGRTTDCCSWDGVECDADTGYVIGLDISSSYLYGPINSNSSLFHLVHLQKLNLADNHFNFSQIPSEILHLSSLTYLNLSKSGFYGQIPSEISKLSNLVSLDLSRNVDYYWNSLLGLQNPDLRGLLQNLTKLEELDLGYVYISSAVPDILGNLSSLRSLNLESCRLNGVLPKTIFQLPNLLFLSLMNNQYLTGNLPEFGSNSRLKVLRLSSTSISGELPDSIRNLNLLTDLQASACKFSGSIPSSIGNMTSLTHLNLALNNFTGKIPSSLANLTQLTKLSVARNPFSQGSLPWISKMFKLTHLVLQSTNLTGNIPYSLRNLTQLQKLDLGYNRMTGQIPSWISNLTQLSTLFINANNLQGPIPESISQLVNLQNLFLNNNFLNGTVKLDTFPQSRNLTRLDLSDNSLSLLIQNYTNVTSPKYKFLGLATCNLQNFPDFLRYQDELELLQLAGNKIHGQIPEWMWNISRNSLWYFGLSYNFLTGVLPSSIASQWKNLRILDISSNRLQGSIPNPPSGINIYRISNNSLSGQIPEFICNLQYFQVLELSHNNLSGSLPQCLGNLTKHLWLLNLQNNFLHGSIPDAFPQGSQLMMIDMSKNQLEGQLPRSLANCKLLEGLNLGNNKISDTFPSWLGSLPNLQVLGLRSNKFYGALGRPKNDSEFALLRVIDLSGNRFTSALPSEYLQIWNGMKLFEADHLTYMQLGVNFPSPEYVSTSYFFYSMVLTKAGVELTYTAIPDTIAAIDLSSNRFDGKIPESIGNLKMLLLLNLSNNFLTDRIPDFLGKLTRLESLDLSFNNLSGEIPVQLTQLTFLGFLNLSHNHLWGRIPQGRHFDTFGNSSFGGNMGLCGKPLIKTCGNSEESSPVNLTFKEDDEDSESAIDVNWMIISIGYGSGLVVGVCLGHVFTRRKHEWIVKTFSRRRPRKMRCRRRGQ